MQRSSSHMIHHTLRNTNQTETPTSQTPTKVNFLHVSKKVIIESTTFVESISTDKQTGTCCPENIGNCIILPIILFHLCKYPATTKWITQKIDETSRSTGMFKLIAIMV
ncbi:hypothetical protein SDC9_177111 [bioreactor metagenome]|uniref:Uncharacterized protein n=1 Tax=bioreactor metagenome TaxID=1076179 RepID=A0A645GS17_9ZZZZ